MRGLVTRWTILVFVLLITGASSLTHADGPVVSNPGVFTDVPAGHWASDSLKYLVDRGIIQGVPSGKFQGDRSPSRYEVATLLSRALHYLEKNGSAAQPIAPDDLKVLQDLIFKLSDRLQQVGGDVDAMKNTNPQMDPALAERIKNLEIQSKEFQDLRAQVQQDQQTIRDLKNQVTQFQIKASTTSEESVAQMNQQILANRIIGIAALLFAVVGIALATLR